jgi:CheY-like chemotaxis protein
MQAVASSPIASIPINGSASINESAPAMVANRLLVVDDEPEICEFIRNVAETTGYEVAVSHNHRQFRSLYEEFNPSAIVLDLRMPEGDGVELLRYLADLGCQADIFRYAHLEYGNAPGHGAWASGA